MAYDAADGYVVLFGGTFVNWSVFPPTTIVENFTWTFRGGTWTNITATAGHAPPPPGNQMMDSMAYDATDRYVVLQTDQGQTWKFLGGTWSRLSPTCVPAGCTLPQYSNMPMAFDSSLGEIVLLGPNSNSSCVSAYARGVWTLWPQRFGGNNTTRPCPPGASFYTAPWGAGLADDPGVGGLALYFGQDTWLFSGRNWTNVTSRVGLSPPGAAAPMMSYDAAIGEVMLYGGCTLPSAAAGNLNCTGSDARNATWTFNGSAWSNVTYGPSPGPDALGSICYDAGDSALLLFGGWREGVASSLPTNSTWVYGSTPPISGLTVVGSPAIPLPGQSVTFQATFRGGSSPFTYSWRFGDGGVSGAVSPIHVYPLVGWYAVSLWLNDSALHTANARLTIHVYVPLVVPVISASPTFPWFGQPVNFSATESGGTPPYNYSWSFGDGGLGGNLQSITHAYTTDGPFLVTLSVSDSAGATSRGYLNITVALSVLAWGNTSSGTAPLTVGFSSTVHGGVPAYSYLWSFGDGTSSTSPSPSHQFTTPGNYTNNLRVTDSQGHTSLGFWNVSVTPTGPPLSISLVAVPSSFVVGNSTSLTATPSGGLGAYVDSWPGLPGWCAVISWSQVKCTPPQPGNFSVTAKVVDATGASASALARLVVIPAGIPLSLALQASPGSFLLGNSTIVTSVTLGGAGGYALSWPGLQSWCVLLSSTSVRCTPTATGSFLVSAQVTDAAGTRVSASVRLLVTAAPPGGSHVSPSSWTLLGLPGTDVMAIVLTIGLVMAFIVALLRSRAPLGDTSRLTSEEDGYAPFRRGSRPVGSECPREEATPEPDTAGDLF